MRGTSSLELERVKLAGFAFALEAEETLGAEAFLEGSGQKSSSEPGTVNLVGAAARCFRERRGGDAMSIQLCERPIEVDVW